jgi:hypothetical protein
LSNWFQFGIRKTAFLGGLVASLGLLISSFFVDRVSEALDEDLGPML